MGWPGVCGYAKKKYILCGLSSISAVPSPYMRWCPRLAPVMAWVKERGQRSLQRPRSAPGEGMTHAHVQGNHAVVKCPLHLLLIRVLGAGSCWWLCCRDPAPGRWLPWAWCWWCTRPGARTGLQITACSALTLLNILNSKSIYSTAAYDLL